MFDHQTKIEKKRITFQRFHRQFRNGTSKQIDRAISKNQENGYEFAKEKAIKSIGAN